MDKSLTHRTVVKELEIFNDLIREKLKVKNLNNTFELSNSLRVIENESGVASVGLEYIEFLDRGRRPGGRRAPVEHLQAWVKRKLGITSEKESLSIAYAIANKQQKEGSEIFKDKSKGLELQPEIQKLRKSLPALIAVGYSVELKNSLYDYWQRKGIKFENADLNL
jgi:hypothetical protein